MARSVIETPYGFVSIARASAALSVTTRTDALDDLTADAMNWAVGEMEAYTGRPLALRTYRDPLVLTGCAMTVDGSQTKVITASDISDLRVFDDALGTGVLSGSRVSSIDSTTQFHLDRIATAGTVTLTCGSAPLILYGNGHHKIGPPESPMKGVYKATYIWPDNTETDIDLTYLRVDKNRLVLGDAVWGKDARIELECMAGYQQPTSTALGDRGDWDLLARIQLRLIQILRRDDADALGRAVGAQAGSSSTRVPDFKLPDDVREMLDLFVRRG